MEKEQKKLLLVAVSVGVFLLVTITVALILLTPKTQPQGTAGFLASNNPVPAGYVQPSESTIYPAPVINNTQETNINFGFDNDEITAEIDTDDGNSLKIQIPVPSSAGVSSNTDAASSAVVTVAPKPAATASSNTASSSAAAVRSTTASAPAAQPARAASSSRTVNDYWIQTGSFSAKIRADDAKELLESKGLTSIIENREINGSTWYRVRLGPYTSENEANYWLALVKTIDGFGESQVWQTTRQL